MSDHKTWYDDTAPDAKMWPQAGGMDVDVAIVGGGYTGLGAALELATRGINVAVFEAGRVGSGASGRNGGQFHTGQRLSPQSLMAQTDAGTARALWDMAEEAKADLLRLIETHNIACDLTSGLIHAWHRPRFAAQDQAYADSAAAWGYDKLRRLDAAEVADELGTDIYHGGLYDAGAGHLHPLKLLLGLTDAAAKAGANIHENSGIAAFEHMSDGFRLRLVNGSTVRCRQLLLCGNGLMPGLDADVDAHILPLHNFMIVTAPLDDASILPRNPAVADSRFVVNYFRKTFDGRLLFGGGEGYGTGFPVDIAARVRHNLAKIYPALGDIEITHAWGGTLAVTRNRAPFVRQLSPNLWVAAGYSGQGVVLAPWFGKLMARAAMGEDSGIDLLARLSVPPFFGGQILRRPLLVAALSYYGLRDRL